MDAQCNIPANGIRRSFISSTGECLFALFLYSIYFKGYSRLAFIQTQLDITLLFLGLTFLVFLYREIENPFAFRIPWSFIWVSNLFLLLAACLVGGLLHTQSIEYGSYKTMKFIVLTGWALFGAVLLITDFQSLKRFSWALIIIAMVFAVDALLGYRGVDYGFPTAFEGDHISLGRVSGLGLLTIIVFLLPIEREIWVKLGLWIMAAILFFTMLISVSLGSILAFIISIILFFVISIFSLHQHKIDRFMLRLFVVTIFAAIILAQVGQDFVPTVIIDRGESILTGDDFSAFERFDLYYLAIDIWAKSPIWGLGTGGFSMSSTGVDTMSYPHNIILELGAENGLPGVLIFVTIIVLVFSYGLIQMHNSNAIIRIVSRYLLVACCFALFNAMVSYDINGNMMLFTFVALLTVIQRFRSSTAKEVHGPK